MKKIIKFGIFLLILVFITGCSVNYNLEFNDFSLTENIKINLEGPEYNNDNIEKMEFTAKNEAYAISKRENQEKYTFDKKENNDKYEGIFSYQYTLDNFGDANLINQCYDNYSFVKTDTGYSLVTSNIFRCGVYSYLKVDSYIVTISTNHAVENHNADKVEGNKYIWKITPKGEINIEKPIRITFSNETNIDKFKNKLDSNSKIVFGFIIVIFGFIGLIVLTVFFIKSSNNNN